MADNDDLRTEHSVTGNTPKFCLLLDLSNEATMNIEIHACSN